MNTYSRFLLVAGLLGTTALNAGCSSASPEREKKGPSAVTVVTLAQKPYIQTTALPGRTTAYLTAEVRPQISGILKKRLFVEGVDVKAGQVLYQVDPAPYQATYDSSQGTLAKAKAAVLSARPQAARSEELVKIDAISQETLDTARSTLAQDEAAVAAAEADLETARINLGYTRLTAPIAGRIGASTYTPGALVTADQTTALATIYQYDPIYVDVTQSSTQFLALRKELASGRLVQASDGTAKVKIVLEDGSDYPLEGRLQFTGVAVDQTTGTITLRALVPNPDKLLLPGMYVHAELEQGINHDALLVPQQGVTHNLKGEPSVLVVNERNHVEERTVQVDGTTQGDWIVDAGLKAGDKVIVEGSQNVKSGDTVAAREQGASGDAPKVAGMVSGGTG